MAPIETSKGTSVAVPRTAPQRTEPAWSRLDWFLITVLLVAAVATRWWRLGFPGEMVFDEQYTVREALCYLNGLPYSDVHPPLPSLCIAASIRLLGNHPWSWRVPGALFGTILIAITYVLARSMFGSRVSATLAAVLVLCDGLFLVDSRTALWEIFYVTFAAGAYAILFRLARLRIREAQRWSLAATGLLLGLSLASKFVIPAIAITLVLSSLTLLVYSHDAREFAAAEPSATRMAAAVVAVAGGAAAFAYLAVFIPNYWFGWWHGVADQVHYLRRQLEFQRTLTVYSAHPYASRWWSWPLMLRAILYWSHSSMLRDSDTKVRAIRAFGNPAIWWMAMAGVVAAAVRAARHKSFPHAFAVIGYAAFLAMWIPIPRFQFVYYYMPALYLGVLALADLMGRCCSGDASTWEHSALLLALSPALLLGLGAVAGSAALACIAIAYVAASHRSDRDGGVLVCAVAVATIVVCFIYFFPVWTGLPLSSSAFQSRMWLHGANPANWN